MRTHRIGFLLVIALGLLVAWPEQAQAQRGGSRGAGGSSRGGSGGGDDERRQRMADFFSRMRQQQGQSGGAGGGDDRSSRMRDFFSRMREQQGGAGGSSRGGSSRGGSSRGGSSRGGERGSTRGRGGSRSSKKKKEPRPRLTVDLPEGFIGQDRDLDGQIGLYEWNLTTLGTFRRIDTNKDGFLTPREFQAAEVTEPPEADEEESDEADGDDSSKKTKTASRSGSRSRGSSSSRSTKSSGSSSSGDSGKKASSSAEKIARFYFKRLDKDKDGKLSAKEWEAAGRVREALEKKKIKLAIPADVDKFAKAFAASRS